MIVTADSESIVTLLPDDHGQKSVKSTCLVARLSPISIQNEHVTSMVTMPYGMHALITLSL